MKNNYGKIFGVLIIAFIGLAFVLNTNSKSEQKGLELAKRESSIEETIFKSFESGNASILLSCLEEEVNLTLKAEEYIYSNLETQEALQLFFDSIVPKKMLKKHSGTSKGGKGQYLIAILKTEGGDDYRCYFFITGNKIESINIAKEKKNCLKKVEEVEETERD